ncbi:hypothetical protein C7212DRAFT_345621 [Tuber magnatum]|uniref:Uncharacterized protein n=1 Tax=Tuber magnatum TaxID=42249 RepID=A0A317SKW1_9PEZI|nr:hypothetical protein C7212DRAFT_345621 [Tuber magnatum]
MLTASLANRVLFHKLRDTDTEDLISRRENSARLRMQFDRIYPIIDWAVGNSDRREVQLHSTGAWSNDGEMVGVETEEEGGEQETVQQAINKLPVNDINPPLSPPSPTSPLLGPRLNPPPAPRKRHHKPRLHHYTYAIPPSQQPTSTPPALA